MSFRYRGLPLAPFAPLFAMSDADLAQKGFRRMVVDEKPGFPCRVTLEDADPGERVLLVTYPHQAANSPYKSSGAIFVRENAQHAYDRVDEVPPVLRERLLSLRAYDEAGMMLDAEIVEGGEIETLLERFFASEATAYVHVHNARRGCFACSVERA